MDCVDYDLFRSSICSPGLPERIRNHPLITPTPYDQWRVNVINGAARIVKIDRDGEVPRSAPAKHIAM